ncbi:hypothetical protein EJD97_021523 [Solanum chilense]|uniref:Uncharacterized protein n=1 Tax=Solanum chilense TaxID=4083 RepID=A0A6N2B336_SOLCI|nr:hypothetical protein EJD97_021523 [Solanum chilense]
MKIIITPFFLLVLLLSRMETSEAAKLPPARSLAPHPAVSPSPRPAGVIPSPRPAGVSPSPHPAEKNSVGPKKVSSAPAPLPPTTKKNNVPLVSNKSKTRA